MEYIIIRNISFRSEILEVILFDKQYGYHKNMYEMLTTFLIPKPTAIVSCKKQGLSGKECTVFLSAL